MRGVSREGGGVVFLGGGVWGFDAMFTNKATCIALPSLLRCFFVVGMDQFDRDSTIADFKNNLIKLMVCLLIFFFLRSIGPFMVRINVVPRARDCLCQGTRSLILDRCNIEYYIETFIFQESIEI